MKQFYTSNYRTQGTNPLAYSVSRFVPQGYFGKRLIELAPTWNLVKDIKSGKINEVQYTTRYLQELIHVDWASLVDKLPDGAILLCYEDPKEFCHRHIIAEMISNRTDSLCVEWDDITPNNDLLSF